MPVCTCELCERTREVQKVMDTGTKKDLVAKLNEIYEDLNYTKFELEYIKACTGNGNWPSCTVMLETMLQKAKEKEQNKEISE